MIRIKVKTMAMLLAVLMLGAGIIYFLLPYFLFHSEKYEVLWKWFPSSKQSESALFLAAEAAEQFTSSSDDKHIFIFPTSSSSSGTDSTVEERQLAIIAFEQLVKQYPASRYIDGVKLKLGKLYLWSKEWDKADKLFAELAASGNKDGEVQAYQAMLNTRKEIPDKEAALTGKVMIGEKPASGVFVVLHRRDDNGWSSPPYLHYPIAITDEQGEYRFYDVTANEYEVGVGVTPAEVSGYYLTQAAREQVSIAAGKTETYPIQFVPQVKVMSPVNKEEIKGDRLRFVWNAYPGTDYYLLSITSFYRDERGKSVGTSTVQLSDEKFKDTTAEYSLEELRGLSRGFGKSYNAAGRVTLSNTGVLGAIFPGGDFIWSVDAYDADGRKISSSSGYYTGLIQTTPFFTTS